MTPLLLILMRRNALTHHLVSAWPSISAGSAFLESSEPDQQEEWSIPSVSPSGKIAVHRKNNESARMLENVGDQCCGGSGPRVRGMGSIDVAQYLFIFAERLIGQGRHRERKPGDGAGLCRKGVREGTWRGDGRGTAAVRFSSHTGMCHI